MRSIAIRMSVRLSLGLSVCPLAYLKNLHVETSQNSLHMLLVAVARSSFDDNAISYVLPVLWMTSCFHTMGQIQIQVWSLRRSELFTVTRQVAPLNCTPGTKSDTGDCLVYTVKLVYMLFRRNGRWRPRVIYILRVL